ncbi:MAG: hypothetical protein V4598_09905 [Bdellovibrionota bacterium]
MRIQLVLLLTLFVNTAFAGEKEIRHLFDKYDAIMLRQRVEHIDSVFTKAFLDAHGGREEFIAMVKELPKDNSKSLMPPVFSWKKAPKEDVIYATLKPLESEVNFKSKMPVNSHDGTLFIIVKEKGKLKIEGTMSDAH